MQLGKMIRLMALITCIALVYIHLQMRIYQLAYQAKVKEHQIQKLRDEHGITTYHILTMKSARHLGQKLLDDQSPMQFASNDKIQEVAVTASPVKQEKVENKMTVGPLSFKMPNFLSVATAQAQPEPLNE